MSAGYTATKTRDWQGDFWDRIACNLPECLAPCGGDQLPSSGVGCRIFCQGGEIRTGPSGFGFLSTTTRIIEGVDLTGKTFVITGVTAGLGLETMHALLHTGARVIGLARKASSVIAPNPAHQDRVTAVACELTDPGSVHAAVRTILAMNIKIDGIVANAGIMALPQKEIVHGVEKQFFVNHGEQRAGPTVRTTHAHLNAASSDPQPPHLAVSHYILITGLMHVLSFGGRVVLVSSSGHLMAPVEGIKFDDPAWETQGGSDGSKHKTYRGVEFSGYHPGAAYGQSKLANILMAIELSKRLQPGQVANALHPGVAVTSLGRSFMKVPCNCALWAMKMCILPFVYDLRSMAQTAATQIYLAAHPSANRVTGQVGRFQSYPSTLRLHNAHARGRGVSTVLGELQRQVECEPAPVQRRICLPGVRAQLDL